MPRQVSPVDISQSGSLEATLKNVFLKWLLVTVLSKGKSAGDNTKEIELPAQRPPGKVRNFKNGQDIVVPYTRCR